MINLRKLNTLSNPSSESMRAKQERIFHSARLKQRFIKSNKGKEIMVEMDYPYNEKESLSYNKIHFLMSIEKDEGKMNELEILLNEKER